MRTRTGAAVAALAVVATMWAGVAARGQSPSVAATTIGVPDRVNEYASVASQGAWVVLAWAASSESSGTDIYASVSRDGGVSFGSPVRVSAAERQASVNGEQPPRVALVGGSGVPSIVVVWTAKGIPSRCA